MIVANNCTEFLSASEECSTVAWSADKGQQLFPMERFSETITSLLLLDQLLVTDRLEDYVCVCNFEADEKEVDEGYLRANLNGDVARWISILPRRQVVRISRQQEWSTKYSIHVQSSLE